MNNPELYHRANESQRYDAENVLMEYASKIQWLENGRDSLIDLGTGSGDVLMDFLYPQMPRNFQRLVCSDINPQMIDYARQHVGHIRGTEFRVFDMGTSHELPSDLRQQFDHVTSFYALMYPKSQKQSIRNIYNLLRPEGGDCLLISLTYHPVFEALKVVSQMEKWFKYMIDVDSFIPPQQWSKDPKGEFTKFLSEAGFCYYTVEIRPKVFIYDSLEVFKTNMMAVNPFVSRMPVSLHAPFMDDVMSTTFQILGLNEEYVDYSGKCPIPYQLAVIYARKTRTKCH